jgi:hypothetical protein
VLRELAQDTNEYVKRKIVKHPKTTPEILKDLVSTNDWKVREILLEHPDLPEEDKRRLRGKIEREKTMYEEDNFEVFY